MSRENHLRLAQAGVLENFWCVAVREEAVGLEIFIDLNEVEIAPQAFARSARTGLAVADDAREGGNPACCGERPQAEDDAGGVTAGIGDQSSLADLGGIELGNSIDGFSEPIGVRRGESVAGGEGVRSAKAECTGEVHDADTGFDRSRRELQSA